MSKKVSEANPGIKALAKKAPEVVQKMGYTMQMNKPKITNANNFSNQDEMRMASSSVFTMGKNTTGVESNEVVVTGDASKINKDVNIPTREDLLKKRKADLQFKKDVAKAKKDEREVERQNLLQVQKDKIANRRLQIQRRNQGMDYINQDGVVVRRRTVTRQN
jgi:hypothetical protein